VAATGTAPPLTNLGVNASNQITLAGFTYDAAGNEKTDVTNTYVWNAESEIKTGGAVNYTYDGDGDRVQKSNGKIYWYGAGSQVLDESDASGNITDEYVYFGGKRVAHRVVSSNSFFFYVEDMLGSSRALATSAGALCYDADFYPYGGEHDYTNTCAQNYKFTGKERDPETNNDDFDARYYSSAYGRFLSADWSSTPSPVPYANLTNPQTLNLYAMVSDNPESFADLDGHEDDGGAGGASAGTEVQQQQSSSTPQNQSSQTTPQQNSGTAQDQKQQQAPISQTSAQPAGGNRTPSKGTPDTTERVPGASPGSYGERSYGSDGRATTDIDHGHDHTGVGDPHAHDWVNGKRQEPRAVTPEESARADTHRFSGFVSDHKGALLTTGAAILVVGAFALAPVTGGASLGALALAP
jgi:RHS repeat-associated protein